MSTESLDTLLACTLMILLTLATMANVLPILQPVDQDVVTTEILEKNLRISEYLLTSPGDPVNWGRVPPSSLNAFGLASETSESPYTLDIDKITRLNSNYYYTLPYTEAFSALGMRDKPFQITITPIFTVAIQPRSHQSNGTHTIYQFTVSTTKSQSPITTELQAVTVIGDLIVTSSKVTVNGNGVIETSLPNSFNGTALLIALAYVQPRTYSYSTFRFPHNTLIEPLPTGNYARLSPLAQELRVDLTYMIDQIHVICIAFDTWILLEQINNNTSLIRRYTIPSLRDVGPMVFVATTVNTTTFIEWTGYPPLPITYGTNFLDSHHLMNYLSHQFLVTIESALYYVIITLGEN